MLLKQVLMLNKGSGHTVHGLSSLPSWTALQLGFPIIPLQTFVVVFVLFVVVFVVVRNATRRLPCGIDSIPCCNVLWLLWDLRREQSSMTSEVRFTMLIQFIMFSVHTFARTNRITIQLGCRFGFDMFDEKGFGPSWASNTIHCTYGQLFVLHCEVD